MATPSKPGRILALLAGTAALAALAVTLILLTGDGDDPTSPEPPVGTAARPAGFGEWVEWDEWRAKVVDVVDPRAAGLLDRLEDPPPPGSAYLAVIYDLTYLGDRLSEYAGIEFDSPNVAVFDDLTCWLDPDGLAEIGIASVQELVPGQTARLARCLEVAAADLSAADLDDVMLTLAPYQHPQRTLVLAKSGEAPPPLEPIDMVAGQRHLPLSPIGAPLEAGAWRASVVGVRDAVADGLLAADAAPPAEGMTYLAATYEFTHSGPVRPRGAPFRMSGLGSMLFEVQGCTLDEGELEALGLGQDWTTRAGASGAITECFAVPTDEVGSFVIRLQSGLGGGNGPVLYPGSPSG